MPSGRVAVVGAGIGGLACGIALQRRGFDVVVYERASRLFEVGSAVAVHANAVLALRELGVDRAVVAAGQEVLRWEFRSWPGELLAAWSQREVSEAIGAPGVTVPRSALQEALLNAFPMERLELGREATGYAEDGDQVWIRFAAEDPIRADLVVAADGLRSQLRRTMLGDEPAEYAGFVSWRGICAHRPPELAVGLARQTLGAGATFGTWSLPGDHTYWVATRAMPESVRAREPEDEQAELRAWFATAHDPIGELIGRTPSRTIFRTPIHHRRPRSGLRGSRTVLIGDAAHPLVPTTGQGGGQALIDALTLAEVLGRLDNLSDSTEVGGALEEFERLRLPAVTAIATEAVRVGESHHVADPAAQRRRDEEFRATPEREWIRRMTARAVPPVATRGTR